MMLKFLRLPVALSVSIISSLSLFPIATTAQEYPACFMVNSSDQIVNLNNICQTQKTICQSPVDKDGFPLILSNQLERLTTAFRKAEQIDSGKLNTEQINFDGNIYEVQSAIEMLLEQASFSPRTRELQKELRLLYAQLEKITNSEEAAQHLERIRSTIVNLKTDSCYAQIIQALEKKFPQRSFP